MVRKFAVAVLGLLFLAGGLLADEVKGKVKSVDTAKKTITVTVGDKDQTYSVAENATVLNANGKAAKAGLSAKALKEGANVTLTTDKKDGKEVVSQIQLGKKKGK